MKDLSENVSVGVGVMDYLTCGRCLKEFPLQKITTFIQHKKLDCEDGEELGQGDSELQCYFCPQGFMTAWGMLIHAQFTHNLRIFLERASNSLPLHTVSESPTTKTQTSNHSPHYSPSSKLVSNLSQQNQVNSDVLSSMPAVTSAVSVAKSSSNQVPLVHSREVTVGDHFQQVPVRVAPPKQDHKSAKFDLSRSYSAEINTNIPRINATTVSPDICSSTSPTSKEVTRGLEAEKERSPVAMHVDSVSSIQQTNVNCSNKTSMYGLSTFQICKSSYDGSRQVSFENRSRVRLSNTDDGPSKLDMQSRVPKVIETPKSLSHKENLDTEPHLTVDNNPISNLFESFVGQKCLITQNKPPESVPSSIPTEEAGTIIKQTPADDTWRQMDLPPLVDTKAVTNNPDPGSVPSQAFLGEESDVTDYEEGRQLCCDNQKCGVTVIPGSHETLKECCNAVVPKKRKRHMETKHMPFSWSSSKYARRKKMSVLGSEGRGSSTLSVTSKQSGSTIYIDVEPDSRLVQKLKNKSYSSDSTGGKTTTTSLSHSASIERIINGQPSKTKSVILKPRATFSIPFTYTIPVSGAFNQAQTSVHPTFTTVGPSEGPVPIDESHQEQGTISSLHNDYKQNAEKEQENNNFTIIEGSDSQDGSIDQGINGGNSRRRKYPTSKPFKCDVCTLAFNQRIHLKKHMSKHTGIKPYKCQQCDYSTVERSHLKVHIRIHTGEKPFKCTYCEYATAQNSTLKIHLKRHHGGRMFQCSGCDKKFTQEVMLSSHVVEHKSTEAAETNSVQSLAALSQASFQATNQQPDTRSGDVSVANGISVISRSGCCDLLKTE